MNLGTLKERLKDRRAELVDLEQALPQVERLQDEVEQLRPDVARLEAVRERFAAFGSKHVPAPVGQRGRLAGVGASYEFELQPHVSVETGRELAARVQADIDYLNAEIKRREREAESLLGGRRRRGEGR